jgi:hypothetical protein
VAVLQLLVVVDYLPVTDIVGLHIIQPGMIQHIQQRTIGITRFENHMFLVVPGVVGKLPIGYCVEHIIVILVEM